MLHIVAIGWIYVVLMMSIAEHSVVAGIMTFLLYGVLPLTIILYLMNTPNRKRRREAGRHVKNSTMQDPVPTKQDAADTGQED